MGIKGLWNLFTPFGEKKSLHEIRGETIAIDLSGWICDSQNVTDYHIQPRLYLRTLYLLLMDVNPVFVLEGDAPELKRDVMAMRNAIQFRGAAPRSDSNVKKTTDVTRKRFHGVLRECESLLKCMGVSCVKGRGEAEATCAQLNSQGLVCAVVSQDSDCFAYGAQRVYRNFSVSGSAGGGAASGSIEVYDAQKMFKDNNFGRNKMVALALLCGCDYGAGACGSSIATVLGFLHSVADNEIIPRLMSWVSDTEVYEKMQRWVTAPGRCDRCGHGGKHKNGCPVCGTVKGCYDTGHKAKLTEVKRELSLRSRAITCGSPFPEPKIMKEFLNTEPENIDPQILTPGMPSLVSFVKLMGSKLEWPQRYCVEKFLPLLTRWHLRDNVGNRTIQPRAIKKKRTLKGVPSYEVIWEDKDGQYEGLIPDEQLGDDDHLSAWTTVERQDLMNLYYPKIVQSYEELIKKPPKENQTRGRKKKEFGKDQKSKRKYAKRSQKLVESILQNLHTSVGSLNNSLKDSNTSKGNVSVSVKKLKRKIKSKSKSKNQKTIDSFIAKKRKSNKKLIHSLADSLQNFSINDKNDADFFFTNYPDNKENQNIKNPLTFFNFDDYEDDNQDLSDIIENMISKAPSNKIATVGDNLVKLIFTKGNTPRKSACRKSILKGMQNCSTPNQSPLRRSTCNNNVNTSYFFDKLTDECDVFEMSTDFKNFNDEVKNSDETLHYNYSLTNLVL